MLIDITELRQAAELRKRAQQAKRLVGFLADRTAIDALTAVAAECEIKATELEGKASRAYVDVRR
jgi:hypothetical protein